TIPAIPIDNGMSNQAKEAAARDNYMSLANKLLERQSRYEKRLDGLMSEGGGPKPPAPATPPARPTLATPTPGPSAEPEGPRPSVKPGAGLPTMEYQPSEGKHITTRVMTVEQIHRLKGVLDRLEMEIALALINATGDRVSLDAAAADRFERILHLM